MTAPFALPVEWAGRDRDVLIDADAELICETEAASNEERAYIELCINQHDRMVDLLTQARFYVPLSNPLTQSIDEALDSPRAEAAGTLCSMCNQPQFMTPSGITCTEGHGGAEAA